MVTWCSRTLLLSLLLLLLLLLFPPKKKQNQKEKLFHCVSVQGGTSSYRPTIVFVIILIIIVYCRTVSRCQKEAKFVLLSLSRTDRGRGGEEFFLRKCMRRSVKSLSGQISRRKIVLSSSS